MAWETRRRGGRYYTRSRKENGRVVREYVGKGEVAQAIAQLEALDRQRQAAESEIQRRERARLEDLEELVAAVDKAADRAFRAAMEAAGYCQHDRGAWRKRRGE